MRYPESLEATARRAARKERVKGRVLGVVGSLASAALTEASEAYSRKNDPLYIDQRTDEEKARDRLYNLPRYVDHAVAAKRHSDAVSDMYEAQSLRNSALKALKEEDELYPLGPDKREHPRDRHLLTRGRRFGTKAGTYAGLAAGGILGGTASALYGDAIIPAHIPSNLRTVAAAGAGALFGGVAGRKIGEGIDADRAFHRMESRRSRALRELGLKDMKEELLSELEAEGYKGGLVDE